MKTKAAKTGMLIIGIALFVIYISERIETYHNVCEREFGALASKIHNSFGESLRMGDDYEGAVFFVQKYLEELIKRSPRSWGGVELWRRSSNTTDVDLTIVVSSRKLGKAFVIPGRSYGAIDELSASEANAVISCGGWTQLIGTSSNWE